MATLIDDGDRDLGPELHSPLVCAGDELVSFGERDRHDSPLVDSCPCMHDCIAVAGCTTRVDACKDRSVDSGTRRTRSAGPRRPNARGHGELLREEIIACAAHLLDELADDEALSLRAVARTLSISPTSVYLYFADRDALVLAVMQRCHDEMLQAASRAEAGHTAPASRLRARIQAQAIWAQGHPGLYKVMHESKASRRPGMTFKEVVLTRTADVIQQCIEAGTAPPGDALTMALDLRAAVIGMLTLRINEPNLPWPPAEQQIDRFLTKLVGLPPPATD